MHIKFDPKSKTYSLADLRSGVFIASHLTQALAIPLLDATDKVCASIMAHARRAAYMRRASIKASERHDA